MNAYGTYQRFTYQTVSLPSIKPILIQMLKALFIVLIALSAIVVAVALFQVVLIVSTWFVANLVNISIVTSVFVVAWMVKP